MPRIDIIYDNEIEEKIRSNRKAREMAARLKIPSFSWMIDTGADYIEKEAARIPEHLMDFRKKGIDLSRQGAKGGKIHILPPSPRQYGGYIVDYDAVCWRPPFRVSSLLHEHIHKETGNVIPWAEYRKEKSDRHTIRSRFSKLNLGAVTEGVAYAVTHYFYPDAKEDYFLELLSSDENLQECYSIFSGIMKTYPCHFLFKFAKDVIDESWTSGTDSVKLLNKKANDIISNMPCYEALLGPERR